MFDSIYCYSYAITCEILIIFRREAYIDSNSFAPFCFSFTERFHRLFAVYIIVMLYVLNICFAFIVSRDAFPTVSYCHEVYYDGILYTVPVSLSLFLLRFKENLVCNGSINTLSHVAHEHRIVDIVNV